MAGYTKLFNSILASTIWRESDQVRILWITMLAMADRAGNVEASIPGLADFAKLSLENCEHALDRLQSPDRYSRTPDHEGRRIEAIAGGWRILNYSTYRKRMSADERREYNRLKKAEERAKAAKPAEDVNNLSAPCLTSQHVSTMAEAEAEAESKSRSLISNNKLTPKPEIVPPASGGGKKARPLYRNERFAVHQWQIDELLSMLGHQAEQFDLHEWLLVGAVKAAKAESGVVGDWWKWLRAETLKEAQRRGFQMASIAVSGNKQIEGLIEGGKRFLEMQRGRV